MSRLLFSIIFVWGLFMGHLRAVSAAETFLLIDGISNEVVLAVGPHLEERMSPCSTFKIALSLMGYDAEVLVDLLTPMWDFQDGYDDWLASWRTPQFPQSWMRHSCIWYSKVLSLALGLEKMQSYLSAMTYGNEDISGGLVHPGACNPVWVNSSLQISPREQVDFIQNMVLGRFPVSSCAVQMTKNLLFREELPGGWRLFGKTGWSGSDVVVDGINVEHGWFVGWIEQDHQFFPFAYLICEQAVNLDQRIPRTKELLNDAGILNNRRLYSTSD